MSGLIGGGFTAGPDGPAFVPTQLPGCVLWLRADLGITQATGVSIWADQSPNGNNFTQSTGANQPGYNTTGNARGTGPALTFNGTSQFLGAAAAILGNTNFSLFVVMKDTSPASSLLAASFGSTNAGGGWGIGPEASVRAAWAFTVAFVTGAASTSNWEEWTVERDSTTWTMSVNGASQSLANATTSPAAQQAGAAIGASGSTGGNLFAGSIDEVAAFSPKLSGANSAQMTSYLRARTGIW